MLESQEVDIFDAGPLFIASTTEIRTIKNSDVAKVTLTQDPLVEESEYILANERLNFRACIGKLKFTSKTQVVMNREVANALLISPGDLMRYVTIH